MVDLQGPDAVYGHRKIQQNLLIGEKTVRQNWTLKFSQSAGYDDFCGIFT